MIINESYRLSNGVLIPKIGFGTWQIKKARDAYTATMDALQAGYRHIDTAAVYGNEHAIGRAIQDSKIPRSELFVTTKLRAEIKTEKEILEAFQQSIKKLGLDYVDLYLIHAPWPWNDKGGDYTKENIIAWKTLIHLYEAKLVRAIGVSNFEILDLQSMIQATKFIPHVNQIPFYIGRSQTELRTYCNNHHILVEAYSPLQTGKVFQRQIVHDLAEKYGVTPAQIALRYAIEQETLPLPKSIHSERIIENRNLDFHLDREDVTRLEKIMR
jgi:diketogulonate reductase-like aldo/keto reductase